MAETLDMLSLLSRARSSCHRIAWRRGKPVSGAEFVTRARAWRSLLKHTPGRAFALYHDDAVEFAAALFGSWHASKTIYLPGDNLPGTCASLSPSVDGYLGEFDSVWAPRVPTAQDCAADVDGFDRIDPEFLGLVLYTSGTTGAAQAIWKKLSQMAVEVATLEKQFGDELGTADILATVSHQHIYGLLFNILWPLAAGRAIRAQNFSFFEELTTLDRDCALVSSPAHLKRLPENPAWPMAAKRLRAIFSSGGPLPFEVAQESKRLLGRVPIEVYGSSETGGIAYRRQETKTNQAWTPFPGVDWRVDAEEKVLEVRSANLPDREWFRTADRATPIGNQGFRFARPCRSDRENRGQAHIAERHRVNPVGVALGNKRPRRRARRTAPTSRRFRCAVGKWPAQIGRVWQACRQSRAARSSQQFDRSGGIAADLALSRFIAGQRPRQNNLCRAHRFA